MKQRTDSSWFCSIMFAALRLGFNWFNEATGREFLIFLLMVMILRLGGAICLPLWPVLPKPIPMTQRGDILLSFLTVFAALRLGFIWFNDEAHSRKFLLFYLHGDDSSIMFAALRLGFKWFNEATGREFLIFLFMVMILRLGGAICLPLWPVLPKPIPTKQRGGSSLSFLTMVAARRWGICHVFQNRERDRKKMKFSNYLTCHCSQIVRMTLSWGG